MVIDASIWISWLSPAEIHHQASQMWLDQKIQSADGITVPTLALAEVAGAMSRRSGLPGLGHEAVEWILGLPDLQVVAVNHALGLEAARIAAEYRLRGADAVYAAVASALGLALYTWDQELRDRAGAFIPVFSPTV